MARPSAFAATVTACLAAGERVRAYFEWDRKELVCEVRSATTGAEAPRKKRDDACLIDADKLPRSTYLLEVFFPCTAWYVDASRLFNLPLARARELVEHDVPIDRETYQVRDALTRALRRPDLFGGAAYAGPPSWECPARARDTERKLAEWPDNDAPHHYPPAGWQDRIGPRDPEDPAYLETLDQLGVRVDNDNAGRTLVTRGGGPILQGPERPNGPGAGAIEYWKARLLALDSFPTYLNSVPVRRIFCKPMRFEVTLYRLSGNDGLGSSAGDPRTLTMTLSEAAARVREGRCPHHKYSAASDRWTEVG